MSESDNVEKKDQGKVLRHGGVEFCTADQLEPEKRRRLQHYKIKPIEKLTFDDIHSYNRDQLRGYCYIYGLARTRKLQMECDMVRHVAAWHRGEPGYDLSTYKPANLDKLLPLSNTEDLQNSRSKSASATHRPQRPSRSPAAKQSPGASASKARPQRSSRSHQTHTVAQNGPSSHSTRPPSPGASPPSLRPSKRRRKERKPESYPRKSPPPQHPARHHSSAPKKPSLAAPRPAFKKSDVTAAANGTADAAASTGQSQKSPPELDLQTKKRRFGGIGQRPKPGLKHHLHEQQAGDKFKAAYNGSGPMMVQVVENAASYLEGKESTETIEDKKKSLERYQFNVNLLNELFYGGVWSEEAADGKDTGRAAEDIDTSKKTSVALAEKMSRGQVERDKELNEIQKKFQNTLKEYEALEKMSIRSFQRLERAKSKEDIAKARAAYEKEHGITFVDSPMDIVKVDLSLDGNEFDRMENACIVKFP